MRNTETLSIIRNKRIRNIFTGTTKEGYITCFDIEPVNPMGYGIIFPYLPGEYQNYAIYRFARYDLPVPATLDKLVYKNRILEAQIYLNTKGEFQIWYQREGSSSETRVDLTKEEADTIIKFVLDNQAIKL